MPPKNAREQEEEEGNQRFYKVIRYGKDEYCESEPMPEMQARQIARLQERTDKGIHATIIPARGKQ